MTIKQILNSKHDIPVILAPMAGVTDLSFREICMKHGCSFTYSEMISAKAISYNNKKTYCLLSHSNNSVPFGVQIFGHEPYLMAEIAHRLCEEYTGIISVIDINMGCPAPKIVNNGDGSALMRNVLLASKIIEHVAKKSNVPITVKFRKGWDENSKNALEFAKMAQDSGAQAVTVHGRTRTQMYSGNADWDIIAEIKSALHIPVIGNGDIINAECAMKMLHETGCDALMVGRASQGNPFIFDEIRACIEGRAYTPPGYDERIKTAIEHAQLHEFYKSKAAFPEMRKHLAWYTRGMKGSSQLRNSIFLSNTLEEVIRLLTDMLDKKNSDI